VVQRSVVVTHTAFAAFGVFWGAWAATLPAIQSQTHASKAELGLALAFLTVGAVPAMLLAGRAVDRFGGAAVAATCALFALAAALPGLAHSTTTLAAALVVAGAGTGAFDVAVNARAVRVERDAGVRLLTAAHGFYSVGVLAGAVLAGVARNGGATAEQVLGAAAAVLLVTALLLAADDVAPARDRGGHLDLRRALIVLGILGAACALVESGLESWSALFVERTFDTSPAVSGLAPGLFGAAMAAGRFSGHALDHVADRVLFAGGAAVAAAGIAVLATSPNVPLALVGVVLGGAGISLTIPLLFGASGRAGGGSAAAVATMTTLLYVGFVLAPPAIGGVAQLGGLRTAFVALAGLAAAIAVLATAFTALPHGADEITIDVRGGPS
jgi:MFS family permease